jgi:hypothetical protein
MKRIAQDQAAEPTKAVAYMRTSSATNVGADKDSERRQRSAIEAYAKRADMVVVDWFMTRPYRARIPSRCGRASPRCLTASRATRCASC